MITLPRWTTKVGSVLMVGSIYLMLFRDESLARWTGLVIFAIGIIAALAYKLYETNTVETRDKDGRVERMSTREFIRKNSQE